MAKTLKVGTKDTCLYCGGTLLYGVLEFWNDTGELVEVGPRYPGYRRPDQEDDAYRAAVAAHEAWHQLRKARGVTTLGRHGGAWMHLYNVPVKTKDDVGWDCPESFTKPLARKSKHNLYFLRAQPEHWCTVSKNEGGDCNRPAKEIVVEGTVGTVEKKVAMCGIHYSHEMRKQKEEKEREEHRALQDWVNEETGKKIARLEKFGITAKAEWVRHYNGPYMGSHTGKVVVDPDQLLEILEANIEVFE